MDSAPQRPWYRLHWLTWALIVVVAGALIQCERERHFGHGARSSGYTDWSYFGWPQAHLEFVESGSFVGAGAQLRTSAEYHWRWSVLRFNLLTCLLILVSTTFVVDSWLRSRNRLQFNLRALLAFTGVAAVMLWMLVNSDWLLEMEDTPLRWVHSPLVSWHDFQQPLRLPVVLGIACTIYSLGWLALALLRRVYRLARP